MSSTLEKISLSKLKLDSFNPRLPKSKQGKDEKTIIEFLLLEAATLELMTAIAENNFFEGELLLVVKDSDFVDSGNYSVIEGNRRLTATKLLSNPQLATVKKISVREIVENAKFKPTELPCLVFENKNDILKYLGFRHITGIKSWRLLEKARYLQELCEREFVGKPFLDTSFEIARMIGSTSAYVKRLLISYRIYIIVEDEKFYQIDGLNDTKFFLNYFTDSLLKVNIRKFIDVELNSDLPLENLDPTNLKKLVFWWFEKTEGKSRVLGDSDGLKLLDVVIGTPKALQAFESGTSIEEAYELTGDLDLQFEKQIKKSLKALEQSDLLSNKVSSFYLNLYEDLKNIRKIAGKINDFKTRLEKGDDDF
jgi:hypothetical protein